MSPTVTGVPPSALTTTSRMSSTPCKYPFPRTMNSRSPSSSSRPPTSRFERLQRLADAPDRDAVRRELLRIDDDLILLLEPADGGDFAHAVDGLQLVLEVEILHAAELREVVRPRRVAERVLVDPADARRVRPERGARALGQPVLDLREVFEHAAPRPVHVGPVLEDDVDEARPEHRVAADGLGERDREERRRERVRHLLLDDLRPLAGVLRPHDDLHVGEVRDRVDGRVQRGPRAERGDHERQDADEQAVAGAPFDEAFEHDLVGVAAESVVGGDLLGRERIAEGDVRVEVGGAEPPCSFGDVGRDAIHGVGRGAALGEERVEVALHLHDLRAERLRFGEHRGAEPLGFGPLCGA